MEGVPESTLNQFCLTRPFAGAAEADHIQLSYRSAVFAQRRPGRYATRRKTTNVPVTVIGERTQVAIVGAGPAGLLLGQLLHRQGIEAVIVEARSRAYVEARIRAGVLEQGTIEVLREAGVGERMDREGLPHGGIYINYEGTRHHIPMTELTGGRGVMIYGQTEVVKDLIAARSPTDAPLRFECQRRVRRGRHHRGSGRPLYLRRQPARAALRRWSPAATAFTASAGRRSPTTS